MPAFRQELPDNLTHLQRQIHRTGTAPIGPVAITPGEGHIRLNDGTNDTGRLDFNGVSIRYRGALRGLTALNESFANSIEAHTHLLAENVGRLNGHDADVARIDAKNAAQDDSLSKKAWTTYVDQQDSALSGRVSSAQSRADSAHANAGTAQNRADAAYSLAASKANVSYVDTKASTTRVNSVESLAQSAHDKVAALRAETRNWMAQARANDPSLPPPIPS